ncbi:MAG: family 10 glycosylhydrolase [Armatimonadota bacterium]
MSCFTTETASRLLLAAAASLLMVSALSAQQAADEGELSLDELREMRREMAHSPRGIIANNDGCDVLYFPGDLEVTVENFLDQRTTALAGTHVGAIAFCPTSSGFSFFTHQTEVGTVLTRQPGDYGVHPDKRNIAQDLIDQGSDCLHSVVEFGHANDMEVFFSMRMNDTHDNAYRPDRPYLLYPPLKEEHPEWLVGNWQDRTPYGRWSSVDYARPEIRDLAFGFIEEVCNNYDVDGVELDFFRHLCYFSSVANGGTATQEQRDMMTDLLQRVRTMTEEVGRERGRPILVAVRVADSVGFNRDMGLDIERWLEEDLLDILITTCYFRLNPWEYSVELGHNHDVAVYPCLSDSRVRGETRFHRRSVESYRGRAMNAWTAGADGIHLFNFFNPNSAVFREVGDPETLATLDKLYFVTVRDGNPNSWLAGGDQYRNVPLLAPSHPVSIAPGKALAIPVMVGEDIERAMAAGAEPTVTLHLEMPGATRPEQVRVALNDHWLEGGTLADGWIDYPVDAQWLERGRNHVAIALEAEELPDADEWSITWDASEKPKAPWHRDPGSERTEERLEDGALLIADRGTEGGDYLHYRYDWGADPDEPVVVEARARVVSGSSLLIVSNGEASERLTLWPDHIELWTNSEIRYDMDTTDDFHTYRIVTEGEDLRVYMDGELRLDATGQFTGSGRTSNQLTFGAANSPMEGEAYWSEVRARLASQGCRDLVVSVTYP